MLRLEAFLDDNKAAKVLHALDGLVIQLQLVPVRNATTKGGKVVGAGGPTTGRQFIMAYVDRLLKAKRKDLRRTELMTEAEAHGISRASVSTSLKTMADEKYFKRKGHGVYLINQMGAK